MTTRLEWIMSRAGKLNAISRIDVLGKEAFRRAGLVAFAAPSDYVRLFVFLPGGRPLSEGYPQGAAAWRYESWYVAQSCAVADKRLVSPIVHAHVLNTSDMVEVFCAAERATQLQLGAWLGKLGWPE